MKNPLEEQIQLVDINEEEERDREMINQFLKKYAKIWKFMFQRYANQAYSTKGKRGDFDDIGNNLSQISLPEITKMLKEHNTFPLLIKKGELSSLIRMINIKTNQTNSNGPLGCFLSSSNTSCRVRFAHGDTPPNSQQRCG